MCQCTPGKGKIPKKGKTPGKAEPKFCYEGECTNIAPRLVRLRPFWTLQFELPGLPKTVNAHRSAGHWARKKHDDQWKEATRIISSKPADGPLSSFSLFLTRYSSNEPDYDGLVSSFKSIVDGLKEAGVIADDKLSNTGPWRCEWIKVPSTEGKIRVVIVSNKLHGEEVFV